MSVISLHREFCFFLLDHLLGLKEHMFFRYFDNLEYLKKLDVRDEMRVGETAYHCYGADDKEYFIRYVSEYEYQKNIKPFVHGIIAKFLNCIPIFCCHLETRYAFLAQFFDDRPPLFFGKLAAFNTLHGNVIVIDLSFCRNTVQTFDSLHFTFTSYGLPHNISLTTSNSYHQYQQQMRELFSTFLI